MKLRKSCMLMSLVSVLYLLWFLDMSRTLLSNSELDPGSKRRRNRSSTTPRNSSQGSVHLRNLSLSTLGYPGYAKSSRPSGTLGLSRTLRPSGTPEPSRTLGISGTPGLSGTLTPKKGSEIRMEDLVALARNHTFQNGVPRIIHYNYGTKMVPDQYRPLVEGCLKVNPSVTFVFWTDSSALDLIRNNFSQYLDMYRTYLGPGSDPLKKSDVIRYFLLYHFGGVYMDLDTRCQRPLETAMMDGGCILSKEAEVQTRIRWNTKYAAMNSLMACRPGHGFFRHILGSLRKDDGSAIMSLTGPTFMTSALDKYNASLNMTELLDPSTQISVASSDTFSPLIEAFLENFCVNPSGEWKVQGCKDLPQYRKTEKSKIEGAVVVHLFYHLGYAFAKNSIKKYQDLSTVSALHFVI